MKEKVLCVLDYLTLCLIYATVVVGTLNLTPRFNFWLSNVFRLEPSGVSLVLFIFSIMMVGCNVCIMHHRKQQKKYGGRVVIVGMLLTFGVMVLLARFSSFWSISKKIDGQFFLTEDGHIAGEKLGIYAFDFTPENSAIRLFWLCSSITSYGPIRLDNAAEELFIQSDSGDIRVVSFSRYADGSWITVKEFSLSGHFLPVYAGEDELKIVTDEFAEATNEIVNLSGMSDAEIGQILGEATWDTLIWLTDEMIVDENQ